MPHPTRITEQFYDAESGDLIVLDEGIVVDVHKSILSVNERSVLTEAAIARGREKHAQRRDAGLIAQQVSMHKEEPYVAPVMFPTDEPVSNDGPLVMPVMTWD
jgi:hypothetical protein